MIQYSSSGPPTEMAPGRSMPGAISVCIVCRNEADRLPACLASVAWADELLVMDLQSDDASATVAASFGARVLTREPLPIVEPLRNEIAAAATGDWILVLDPDERVTPGLAQALQKLAARTDVDAVVIPRMNCDLGYAPTHPIQRYEPQLRMYRRERVRWPTTPNKLPEVPRERLVRLPAQDELVLIHERSRNVPEIVERVGRYAPMEAQAMIDRGEQFNVRRMIGAIAAQAEKEFLHAEVWHDGVPGVLRAGLLVAYKFYVWTALWQLSGVGRTEADDRYVRRFGLILRTMRWILSLARRLKR